MTTADEGAHVAPDSTPNIAKAAVSQGFFAEALHHVVDSLALQHPDRLVAIDDAAELSYRALVKHSTGLAQRLLLEGVVPLSVRPLATLCHRGCSWLCMYVACMRLGVPIVALSGDLSDHEAESGRNADALERLHPQRLVVQPTPQLFCMDRLLQIAASLNIQCLVLSDLVSQSSERADMVHAVPVKVARDALLAYCYTGGTTRASKAVKISHAMALHEIRAYPHVLPASSFGNGASMRFLQNSSAYWGAALLGQIDVPLAFGGTIVFVNALLPSEIICVINKFEVTAFGAVPSVLAHFGAADVPSVRCVISWAEELPEAVASAWRTAVPLRDLLIATEYWLTFYSTRCEGRGLQCVPGVLVVVLHTDSTLPVKKDEIGEVCIGGDTVSPGYTDEALDADRFVDLDGTRFFRTRDLAKRVPLTSGDVLEFCGRCDEMCKVGGKWVDVSATEAVIREIEGVRDIKLLCGVGYKFGFLLLESAASPQARAPTIELVQRALPEGTLLHVLSLHAFPVNASTGKIDRKALLGWSAILAIRDRTGVVQRRGRVAARFARSYRCLLQLCHHDPRRMLCMAFVWYGLLHCPGFSQVKQILNTHFPLQGGFRGAVLALVWALPLDQLQRLAAPGAAQARAHGRGLEWAAVFWAAIPHWLPSSETRMRPSWWAYQTTRGAERATWALQRVSARWLRTSCPSCRHNAVTLFPNLTHCCDACCETGGERHDSACLLVPVVGQRKCDHCDYATTWDIRFCCYNCEKEPNVHGPHCDQRAWHVASCVRSSGTVTEAAERTERPQEVRSCHAEEHDAAQTAVALEELAAAQTAAQAAPATDVEAVVLSLVAGISGVSATPDDILGPLESLRALRLLEKIRQELGRNVTLRDLSRCVKVSDLTRLVQAFPTQQPSQSRFADPGAAGFRLWTFGWNSCLQWVFRCTQPLDQVDFKAIVRRLVERQPALRLRSSESREMQTAFMEAAVIQELYRKVAESSGMSRASSCLRVLDECLKAGWPRWYTDAPDSSNTLSAFSLTSCDAQEVNAIATRLRKCFCPPFQLAVLTHPEDSRVVSHVCVMLSHAIADGTAVMPFLHDFAELWEEEIAVLEADAKSKKRRLPRRAHFGALLEDRLLRSLSSTQSDEDLMFLDRRMDFFRAHFPENRGQGYRQAFDVLQEESKQLRQVVDRHLMGCPLEIIMLSMVVLTIARAAGEPHVKFTLVHHGRDHPLGAADLVGFFTDFRILEVPTSHAMSLIGVVSWIANAVRERLWRVPEPLEPIDILINIVPAPFTSIGPLGQISLSHGRAGHTGQDGALWQERTGVNRPLELQIEQVGLEEWCVTMYLLEQKYPMEIGQRFRTTWTATLHALVSDPLSAALPRHSMFSR